MRLPRSRPLRSAAAAALVLALGAGALGACGGGDDDGGDDEAASTTPRAPAPGPDEGTTAAPGGGAGGAGEPIDDAIVTEAATGVRGFFERVEISDERFREMAVRACAVVAGPDATPEARAQAVVDDIPDGPDHPHYVPAMILFAQLYLSQRDCGTDAATAQATREALVPLQDAATAAAVSG